MFQALSGDQGRAGLAILKDPAPLPACDYLICESTYGGRANPPAHEMRSELANIVNATIRDGGKIIIPAFAVGRTQTVVYQLHRLIVKGLIPAKVPIIVDGPLASRATEIYRRHPETYDREAAAFNHDTQGSGGMLQIFAHLAWISFIGMMVGMFVFLPQGTGGLGALVGFGNRLLVIAYAAWLVTANWPLLIAFVPSSFFRSLLAFPEILLILIRSYR